MRLGKMEKSVLSCIESKEPWREYGGYWCAQGIAWSLRPDEADGRPSPALEMSVRRAIYSLTRKGLLCSGAFSRPDFFGRGSHLWAWLPGRVPPAKEKSLDQELVLSTLKELRDTPAEPWADPHVVEGGFVLHRKLASKLAGKMGGCYLSEAHRMQLTRLLRQLSRDGKVELKTRYGWPVRPVRAVKLLP